MSKKPLDLASRDLGPAPIDSPEQGLGEPFEPPEYKPPPRINPKIGLEGMTWFVMELVARGQMRDVKYAEEAWIMLKPADLEKLTDIADTLEFFRLKRQQERMSQQRKASR